MAEQTPPKEKLVGDLETLVTLLEEGKDPTLDMFADEPIAAPPVAPQADQDANLEANLESQPNTVPPLAEITPPPPQLAAEAAALPEFERLERTTADFSATLPPPQNQDLFDALLGTGWEAESTELLETASATIQAQQLDWNPDDTQALTDALRVRLEQSINGWLSTTLVEQVALLKQQLLVDLQDELTQRVQATLQINQQQRQTKEDGLSQLAEDHPADPAPTGNP